MRRMEEVVVETLNGEKKRSAESFSLKSFFFLCNRIDEGTADDEVEGGDSDPSLSRWPTYSVVSLPATRTTVLRVLRQVTILNTFPGYAQHTMLQSSAKLHFPGAQKITLTYFRTYRALSLRKYGDDEKERQMASCYNRVSAKGG